MRPNGLKQAIFGFANAVEEYSKIVQFAKELQLKPGEKILEVGCGYGEKLRLLRDNGFNVVGVEVNPMSVADVRKQGFECHSVEEFDRSSEKFDAILMSHVVEHFTPDALLKFIDHYLDRLKTGGHLIVVTPLMSNCFYNDFDHIRPYQPTGFAMVFGDDAAQVQFRSRHRLALQDIWFKKSPPRIIFAPGLYVGKYSKAPYYLNLLLRLAHRLSFRLISRTDGWIGIYRKTN